MLKQSQMEMIYSIEETEFIEKHAHAVLSICNSRNYIIADWVVFREYDNGGLGMELFKDELWARRSTGKQSDTRQEFVFLIQRLVFYFYGKGKITI